MKWNRIVATLGVVGCVALMGLFRLPGAGRAGGGELAGCGGAPVELAGEGGGQIADDAPAPGQTEQAVSAKLADWNSCYLSAKNAQTSSATNSVCIEQWGSFPLSCDCFTWSMLMFAFTAGEAETYCSSDWFDFTKVRGKRCKGVGERDDGTDSEFRYTCKYGRFSKYNTGYSALLLASAYTCEEKPSASNIKITQNGTQLSIASYTYSQDQDGPEKDSKFAWKRASSSSGTFSTISGATSQTWTFTDGSLVGDYVKGCVTPGVDVGAWDGTRDRGDADYLPVYGEETCSSAFLVTSMQNDVTTVTDLALTFAGNKATGSFTYTNNNDLTQYQSTRWIERAADANGTGAFGTDGTTSLGTTTTLTRTLTIDDVGKYLRYCAKANSGSSWSSSECTSWTAVPETVVLYKDANWQGGKLVLAYAASNSGTCFNLSDYGSFNDVISSHTLNASASYATTLVGFKDADCSNQIFTWTTAANASTGDDTYGSANDTLSSVRVVWNSQPTAVDVALAVSGGNVQGTYEYANGSVPEGTSTLEIQRASSSSATSGTTLTTASTYTLTSSDDNLYLRYCVTPKDLLGNAGSEVCSGWKELGSLVRLYEHTSGGGTTIYLSPKGSGSGACVSLSEHSFNDKLSSFYLPATSSTTHMALYADADCTGSYFTKTAAANGSTTVNSMPSGFNDVVTSVVVGWGTAVTASDLAVTVSGSTSVVGYTYNSVSNMPEASTVVWYRGDSDTATTGTAQSATSAVRDLVADDSRKWLKACVTPKDVVGNTGTQVCSSWTSVGAAFTVWDPASQSGTTKTVAHEKWDPTSTSKCINLSQFGMNDLATLVRLDALSTGSARFTLWQHADCGGMGYSWTVTTGNTKYLDLSGSIESFSPGFWNNMISSIKIVY